MLNQRSIAEFWSGPPLAAEPPTGSIWMKCPGFRLEGRGTARSETQESQELSCPTYALIHQDPRRVLRQFGRSRKGTKGAEKGEGMWTGRYSCERSGDPQLVVWIGVLRFSSPAFFLSKYGPPETTRNVQTNPRHPLEGSWFMDIGS